MAKTLKTRIKNRYDSLTNWSKEGIELLQGEIALVKVETEQIDQATGDVVKVPAFLMKVGENDANGTPKAFSTLPWLSALAADVYDWAKVGIATDVPVTVNGTASTLGAYLAKVNTNASNIAGVSAKVDVDKVSTAISSAISTLKSGLKHSGTKGTNQIVKAVTQSNGVVTVTYGTIAEAELPSISTDKVYLAGATSTTLTSKLGTMDAAIDAVETKLDGVTKVTTSISNAIAELDVAEPEASGTSTSFIATAKQTDGKIVVTKKSLPTADASTKGITKLYTSVGTSTDGTVTRKVVNDINTQVNTNKADIASLKTAVAGGIHFIGTVTTEPGSTTLKIGEHDVIVGDVVLYKSSSDTDYKEYICTDINSTTATWEVLGDVTRIGALEKKVNDLDVTTGNDVTATNKFVSQVKQTNGKIAVTYTQPTSANISHDGNTVKVALENLAANKANASEVYTKTETNTQITNAINGLDVSAPIVPTTGTTTATAFIDSISQTDGKISATKKNLPNASTSAKGIVQLNNTVTSTSTTEAATANAVKTAYDKAASAASDAASKVASVSLAGGTNNGTLKLTVNGTATDNIAVTGLGSAAYTASTAYAPKAHASSATTYGAGSSSNYGHVKLSDSTSSTSGVSGGIAATPAAVKAAYDKGAAGVADAAAISANYVRVGTGDKLVHYVSGTDYEIILDCGGAE